MTVWYMAQLSGDPRIADLMADELVQLPFPTDPAIRVVLGSAMLQMSESQSARILLRDQYLGKEGNEDVLSILLSAPSGEHDPIQRLYDVKLEKSNAP